MAQSTSSSSLISDLLEMRGPATVPLDSAADYIRGRFDRVLPLYLLAMAPHAIATTMLIDAAVGLQRSNVAMDCLYLSLAMIWRWVWLARLQMMVQNDLREGRPTAPWRIFWRRIPLILRERLISNIAITWGGLLIFPSYYGVYVGGFIAPFYLEHPAAPLPRLRQLLSWMRASGSRLLRILFAMTVLVCALILAMLVTQTMLARTLLPSLLGIDTVDLNITLESWGWRLRLFYAAFLLLDGFWTVAAVFIYYDSQSHRMATDLRMRLIKLTEAPE